jgi:predicted DNA-binding transcriptional regulator AlpA
MKEKKNESAPKDNSHDGGQSRRPGRRLRLRQVLDLFPVSRSTWYAGIKDGIYPQGERISARSVAWHEEDIWALRPPKAPPSN